MNASTNIPLGLQYGMTAEQYHATPALSNSMLSDLARSPAHCWALHHAPDRPQRTSTASMQAGTLAHALILELAAVPHRFAVRPSDLDGRTKDGKAWLAKHSHLTIVTAEQMATAEAQRAAVLAVPELSALLAKGAPEVSAFWIDGATGTQCKLRADWVHPLADGRVILLDIKTTADASPAEFGRSVWRYGYHRQAAWYSSGFEQASGAEVAAFVFAAVTSDYPFLAVAYMLDDAAHATGAEHCASLLSTYAQCAATNDWPAYGAGVQTLSLPAWAK